MKLSIYIGKREAEYDLRISTLIEELQSGGCEINILAEDEIPASDTDMLLSVGGDGSFLNASMLVAESGIPVVGVNAGRLGFLSENRPEDVAKAILSGDYATERRSLLEIGVSSESPDICPQ